MVVMVVMSVVVTMVVRRGIRVAMVVRVNWIGRHVVMVMPVHVIH
jgi:hypothetical protein